MKRDLVLSTVTSATDSLVAPRPAKRQMRAPAAAIPLPSWTLEATKKELWRLPKDLVKDIVGLYFAITVNDMEHYELERLERENEANLVIHFLGDYRPFGRGWFHRYTNLWCFMDQDPRALRRQMRIQSRYISTDENRLVTREERKPVTYYERLPEALGPYLFHLAHTRASRLLIC